MVPIATKTTSSESLTNGENIPLGEYLFLRICQANPRLKSIFGIPGDFNLNLLEHLYSKSVAEDKQIRFINLCNELNASYTADGYAKVINGLAVLITTYGVGELSAINGVSGAFAEFAPVLHIVGTTSSKQMEFAETSSGGNVVNIHHLVQNKNPLCAPDHNVYKKLVNDVSMIQESLTSQGIEDGTNLEKIDKVLRVILAESRPGYLYVPSDIPDMMVPSSRLLEPLEKEEVLDRELLSTITKKILSKLYNSKRPAILGDALIARFGLQKQFEEFVAKLPASFVRLFSTNMSRYLDETLPNFVGTYYGALTSSTDVRADLELNTDLLITFGYMNAETNTGVYTSSYKYIDDYVEIHPDYVFIDGEYYVTKNYKTGERKFSMEHLVQELRSAYDASRFVHNSISINNISFKSSPTKQYTKQSESGRIQQTKLVDYFNKNLQENDILIVETCTFLFSVPDLHFPKGVSFFSQNFYGSIGYALPATLGACVAEHDLGTNRRIILVEGDGSAQMTVQELSTFLRYDIVPPKIFLINNEGYTVERVIKGPTRSYNDIQDCWQWTKLLEIFGDVNHEKHSSTILKTDFDLDKFNMSNDSKIQFIELSMDKLDTPERLQQIATRKLAGPLTKASDKLIQISS
ncbi:Transaminated amino acid decarboxylase [Meyerozyma sp. JA9]|nr:Transaminated amino acid decarboxylase [Meyerozyma sp. JA9]